MNKVDAVKRLWEDWYGAEYELGKRDCVQMVKQYLSLLGVDAKPPRYYDENELNAKAVKRVLGPRSRKEMQFGDVVYYHEPGGIGINLGWSLLVMRPEGFTTLATKGRTMHWEVKEGG